MRADADVAGFIKMGKSLPGLLTHRLIEVWPRHHAMLFSSAAHPMFRCPSSAHLEPPLLLFASTCILFMETSCATQTKLQVVFQIAHPTLLGAISLPKFLDAVEVRRAGPTQ